jgi:hypothetical protein
MLSLDARARKIAEYAKAHCDSADLEDAVKAVALAELHAAVRDETARCTALIRQAMGGGTEGRESSAPAPKTQRKRRS